VHGIFTLLTVLLAVSWSGQAQARFVWGDLHAHSGLSDDGVGDPRDFFRDARDYYLLDFVVLSDHDIFLTPEEEAALNQAAAEYDEPGRFVAFPGVEWTHAWHMNFYFRDPDSPICGGGSGPPCDGGPDARSFYASRVFADEAAAHVNHPHPLSTVQWSKMRDDVTTNVEVWNTHWNRNFGPEGNDSWFGGPLWALRMGFRLGFVGASDDHTRNDLFLFLGSGLTGCDVEELTRAAIIDALRHRRCYASNGTRVALRFDVGGTSMGGETSAPIGSAVTANVSAIAPTKPTAIEILANGISVARTEDCTSGTCSFSAPIPINEEYNFIYAKVYEGPTQRTWSSPVWVRGICGSPQDCPVERFVPGMGHASTRCLAGWRVVPAADHNSAGRLRRRATCVQGDPECDFDASTAACTFRVGLCTGVDPEQPAPCSLAPAQDLRVTAMGTDSGSLPDDRNAQTLGAAAQALLSAEAPGRCGPYVPVIVPLRQSASGTLRRGTRTFILRSATGKRRDRDRLTLVCEPPGR